MVGCVVLRHFAALEFDGAGKEMAQGGEQGAGFLFGEVFQVCSVDGGDGVVEQFFDLLEAALAGGGGAGLFEGGLFFAFVLVVGEGAFGPAPKGGLLVQGSGRSAAAICPYLIGSREVAGWAEQEIDMEAGVAFDGFVRLPLPGFG